MSSAKRVPRSAVSVLLLAGALLALAVTRGMAAPVLGVEVPGAPPVVATAGPAASPTVGEVLIDFEDPAAPCVFAETTPLRDRYLAQGVRFFGPGPNDGGAILDACGNFVVSGYSGLKFLAFNEGPFSLDPGYLPGFPEHLVFTAPVASVSLLAGGGFYAGSPVTMNAYDNANVLVATSTIVIASALAPVTVSAPGITHVDLLGPTVAVFDDLRFTPGGPVASRMSSWGRLKAHYR